MRTSQIGANENRAGGAPITLLVIGGLDPSGGAGLVRDVLTAAALGAHPRVVGTAWTEQGPSVHAIEARDVAALGDSVRHALSANPGAVKIGMIPSASAATAVLGALADFTGPIVVDPVLASSRGGALFRGTPDELLPLLRRATLVTPNALEAATLTGRPVRDLDEAATAVRALGAGGMGAVLLKGGHIHPGAGAEPMTDTLLVGGEVHRLAHARVPGGEVRGTGCALATAIAVHLAQGTLLLDAVRAATGWLERALVAAVKVGDERHLG